jgi:ribosomal protein S18 acetylase RimI-like enzyme
MNKIGLSPEMLIRPFETSDEGAIIELWYKCNLIRPQNDPELDIARKLKVYPELFLVGLVSDKIIASAMGGYEGHRGWVNYLAVDPDYQKRGLGRAIMEALETRLLDRGCPKLNLQVRNDNIAVIKFYENIGYKRDDVLSFGKRLIQD